MEIQLRNGFEFVIDDSSRPGLMMIGLQSPHEQFPCMVFVTSEQAQRIVDELSRKIKECADA